MKQRSLLTTWVKPLLWRGLSYSNRRNGFLNKCVNYEMNPQSMEYECAPLSVYYTGPLYFVLSIMYGLIYPKVIGRSPSIVMHTTLFCPQYKRAPLCNARIFKFIPKEWLTPLPAKYERASSTVQYESATLSVDHDEGVGVIHNARAGSSIS